MAHSWAAWDAPETSLKICEKTTPDGGCSERPLGDQMLE